MGPDTYILFGLLLALAVGVLAGRLIWMRHNGASSERIVDRGKYYLVRMLLIILVLLGIEVALMVLSGSSYYDVFQHILRGAMRWRPSLEYGWLLVHRLIWILLVVLALYFVRSGARHILFLARHGRQIKEALLRKANDPPDSLPRGIKAVALLQLLFGGYYLLGFAWSLLHNLSPLDLQFWSSSFGFGSYEAAAMIRASIGVVFGLALLLTGARLLYRNKDAWWVSLIALIALATGWAYAAVYYYYHPTYGGILTSLIALLWMTAFALPAVIVWRARALYRWNA